MTMGHQRNGPSTPTRGADGKLTGGSLRKVSQLKNARGLARWLRREMKRRHKDARAHYGWLIDIAESAKEKASDRIKAIEQIALRMDGKPVDTVQLLSDPDAPRGVLESMTVGQLLALARQAPEPEEGE
jgi:hypothetical protein